MNNHDDKLDSLINGIRRASQRKIVETGIALTEADAIAYKLRGWEQSKTDPQLWHKWSS